MAANIPSITLLLLMVISGFKNMHVRRLSGSVADLWKISVQPFGTRVIFSDPWETDEMRKQLQNIILLVWRVQSKKMWKWDMLKLLEVGEIIVNILKRIFPAVKILVAQEVKQDIYDSISAGAGFSSIYICYICGYFKE